MKKILMAAVLAAGFSAAHAEVFNFSYDTNGNGVLRGQLDGALGADGNSIAVSSILDFASLDGVNAPSLFNLLSTDTANFGTPNLKATVTLDGSFMDLAACDGSSATCSSSSANAFTFNQGNLSASTYGTNGAGFFATGGFFGGYGQDFVASNWHISAVPEPTTVALLGLGLVTLIGAQARKKKASQG